MNLRKDHSHKMFYSTRHAPHSAFCFIIRKSFFRLVDVVISSQCLRCYLSLATTNALARGSLKDAANCAKHLELQISEKEKDSERILRVDFVSAHVIGGDRNMQSLELLRLSGITCCRKFFRRRVRVIIRVSRFRAALWIQFHDVRIQFRVSFSFSKTFFHARSRPVTGLPAEFKHINKRRTSN